MSEGDKQLIRFWPIFKVIRLCACLGNGLRNQEVLAV